MKMYSFLLVSLLSFFGLSCDFADPARPGSTGEILFCEDCGGVFKTTTSGASWYQVGVGLPPKAEIHVSLAGPFDKRLWAIAKPRFGIEKKYGLYQSTDGGERWIPRTTGLPD